MANNARSSRAGAGSGSAAFGLGLIGALVYFWEHAHGFWGHVGAVLEALVWPAFVVYDLLGHIR